MSKITHVIVELNMPIDTKWFRPDINDEYWGEGKPLIMCKDCKYCMAVQIGYNNVLYNCDIINKMRFATDYCSMAIRRDE